MLLTFLKSLRSTGQAVLDPPQGEVLPAILAAGGMLEEDLVINELEPWFLEERMRVPGDPLEFHPQAALWGAKWIFRAACFYTFREIVEQEVQRALKPMLTNMPDPESPAAHLSADLMLQHLPVLHNRCIRLAKDDVLTIHLEKLASQLPLSGVGIADRTVPTDHPILNHPAISQYIIERAIDLKCRNTLEIDQLNQLAVEKLGAYTDRFSANLLAN